jgi:hypothetical protein
MHLPAQDPEAGFFVGSAEIPVYRPAKSHFLFILNVLAMR